MDAATLAVICAIACGGWLLLARLPSVGRLARATPGRSGPPSAPIGGRVVPAAPLVPEGRRDRGGASRRLLEEGIRSDRARACASRRSRLWAASRAITSGPSTARSRRSATELEPPVRVATELDRLAPRPGSIGSSHCSAIQATSSASTRSGCSPVSRSRSADTSHRVPLTRRRNVRAAALETLRATAGSTETLRGRSICLLTTPSRRPRTGEPHGDGDRRTSAQRASSPCCSATSRGGCARRPARRSWPSGPRTSPVVLACSRPRTPSSGHGAALVLQDVGAVDDCSRRTPSDATPSGFWRRASTRRLRRGGGEPCAAGSSTSAATRRDRLGAGAVTLETHPPGLLVLVCAGYLCLRVRGLLRAHRARLRRKAGVEAGASIEDSRRARCVSVLAGGQRARGRLQRGGRACRTPSARFSRSTTPSSR